MKSVFFYEWDFARIGIAEEDGAVTNLFFGTAVRPSVCPVEETALLREASRQLREYFDLRQTVFDFPIRPKGTEFERVVWTALQTIPYGEVRTYGQIAEQIGRHCAYRAVGRANGANPIAIVIPCHRVIGSNGTLTGYSAGMAFKETLLKLEKKG